MVKLGLIQTTSQNTNQKGIEQAGKILKKLGTDFFDFGDYSEVIANGFDN